MAARYLILKGCAGFGNRVLCLVDAIRYAEKTNRHLIIDWNDGVYFEKGYNFFNDYFTLENISYSCPNSSVLNLANFPAERVYPTEFKQDISWGIYDQYVQVRNNVMNRLASKLNLSGNYKGHWMHKSNYSGVNHLSFLKFLKSCLTKSSFPLGENMSTSLEQDMVVYADYTPSFHEDIFKKRFRFNQNLIDLFESNKIASEVPRSIGVHVRDTDLKPTKNVLDLVEFIKQNHPGESIFLATDNPKIQDLFQENFSRVLLVPKNLDTGGKAIHKTSRDATNLASSKLDFEHSLTDLYFLGQSKKLYYQGNSSFSILARCMNKSQSQDWLKLKL